MKPLDFFRIYKKWQTKIQHATTFTFLRMKNNGCLLVIIHTYHNIIEHTKCVSQPNHVSISYKPKIRIISMLLNIFTYGPLYHTESRNEVFDDCSLCSISIFHNIYIFSYMRFMIAHQTITAQLLDSICIVLIFEHV